MQALIYTGLALGLVVGVSYIYLPVIFNWQWKLSSEQHYIKVELGIKILGWQWIIWRQQKKIRPLPPRHDAAAIAAAVDHAAGFAPATQRAGWSQWREAAAILRWLVGRSRLAELEWFSRIGGGDAMCTALASGGLWAVKGALLGVMARGGQLRRVRLQVAPDYHQTMGYSSFKGIFKVRVVHIIITGLKALLLMIRWWLNGQHAKRKKQSPH